MGLKTLSVVVGRRQTSESGPLIPCQRNNDALLKRAALPPDAVMLSIRSFRHHLKQHPRALE